MKKSRLIRATFVLGVLGINISNAADIPELATPALDKVTFQVSSKQWVSTTTALVSVNINLTLNNADLAQARAEVLSKLNSIVKSEWHIIQFDRSQDNSGLEKLFVVAEARVAQESLTDIYKHAKSVSKPGAAYSIGSVEFKPSLQEMQQVKALVRDRLYHQVWDEMQRLNKAYPEQKYTLHAMSIYEGEVPSPPAPNPQPYAMMNKVGIAGATSSSSDLAVSNEVIMSASVEAGSTRR